MMMMMMYSLHNHPVIYAAEDIKLTGEIVLSAGLRIC